MKKNIIYIFAVFVITSGFMCQPEEPEAWNKYSSHTITSFGHGEIYVRVSCINQYGPDCVQRAISIITQAEKDEFGQFKQHYEANDVPAYLQNGSWRELFPELDPAITEKLINREYTMKMWNPEEDLVTMMVLRQANEDYSPENVVYAYQTYHD